MGKEDIKKIIDEMKYAMDILGGQFILILVLLYMLYSVGSFMKEVAIPYLDEISSNIAEIKVTSNYTQKKLIDYAERQYYLEKMSSSEKKK